MKTELSVRRKEYDVLLVVFKYMPVVGVLLMLSYVVYLLHGNHLLIKENFTSDFFMSILLVLFFFFMFLQLLLSHFLGFCLLHRLMIMYIIGMGCCILWEYFFGFGALLTPARWFMFGLGVVLLGAMFKRGCWTSAKRAKYPYSS